MSEQFLNIAGYRFFPLEDPQQLKQPMLQRCLELDLKGTIILAEEGINSFLAGTPENIQEFQKNLAQWNFPEIEYKESWTETIPFKRMFVKIKKEIVTMGWQNIQPQNYTGPRISAQELKKWLDEERQFHILDTRNDYETQIGKFKNAIDLEVGSFVEFSHKAKQLPEEMKQQPVVMYCTGGIRCEKASALLMKEYGFQDVYQLEGGILKYFEQCGNAHYEGECFVFDERVSVDSDLQAKS